MRITQSGQTFHLLAERALYWQEEQILLLADTHFGKTGTFRQSGLHLPEGPDQSGTARLDQLLHKWNPKRCIILGDFFHSSMNHNWKGVAAWTASHARAGRPLELIPGNHDILQHRDYEEAGIRLLDPVTVLGPLRLVHEPPNGETAADGVYTLCGHLHPGIRLEGKGRQRMTVPCFLFGEHTGVLPAFGGFTGLHVIRPCSTDRIYVPVAESAESGGKGSVLAINQSRKP